MTDKAQIKGKQVKGSGGTVWGDWQELSLTNGWATDTVYHQNRRTNHYRTRGTELELALCVKNTNAQLYVTIATLPVGFRPSVAIDLAGLSDIGTGATAAGIVVVGTNGNIHAAQLAGVNGNAYLVVRGVIQLS